MKKICALVLVLGSLAVAPGCNNDKCGVGPEIPYFDVQGFSAQNILKADSALVLYQSHFPVSHPDSTIEATTFGIELSAEVTYTAKGEVINKEGSFGYAFACPPTRLNGWKGSKETIEDIIIRSDSPFSAELPAGVSLNELFAVSARGNYSEPYDSLTNQAIPLTLYLSSQPRARQRWQLWLTQRPETALTHQFTVFYRQTNGEEYTVTTSPVTFQ